MQISAHVVPFHVIVFRMLDIEMFPFGLCRRVVLYGCEPIVACRNHRIVSTTHAMGNDAMRRQQAKGLHYRAGCNRDTRATFGFWAWADPGSVRRRQECVWKWRASWRKVCEYIDLYAHFCRTCTQTHTSQRGLRRLRDGNGYTRAAENAPACRRRILWCSSDMFNSILSSY